MINIVKIKMNVNQAKDMAVQRVAESSTERRAREKQDLRAAILHSAGEVFLERGYDGLSMRQVAERIGYTATTLYLYFKNKDDLLFALLDDGYAELGRQLAAAAAAESDPFKRLAAVGQAYVAFGLQNPSLYQVMFLRRADFLAARLKEEHDTHINAFEVLTQAVMDALAAGALAPGDVLVYATAMWALVHGIVSLAIVVPLFAADHIDRVARASLDGFCSGFRA